MSIDSEKLKQITLKQLTSVYAALNGCNTERCLKQLSLQLGADQASIAFIARPDLKKDVLITINSYIKEYQTLPFLSENIEQFLAHYETTLNIILLLEDCLNSGMNQKTAISIFNSSIGVSKRFLSTHYKSKVVNNGDRKLSMQEEFKVIDFIRSQYGNSKSISFEKNEFAEFLLLLSKQTTAASIASIEATLNEHEYKFELKEVA